MRSYEFGDPLRVLIRRGQDCTNCRSLEQWQMGRTDGDGLQQQGRTDPKAREGAGK